MQPHSVTLFGPPVLLAVSFSASVASVYGPAFVLDYAVIRQEDSPPKNEPMIKEGYGPD